MCQIPGIDAFIFRTSARRLVLVRRHLACALVAILGLCFAAGGGCSTLRVPFTHSLALEKEEPVVVPQGLAIVWTNAVLEAEGGSATRGLGGLVTFQDSDRKSPVRVDGQLTIYAYEETARPTGESVPSRKYVFTPEQLAQHYGKGPMGPAYSIWIPWDKLGGPRQEISLVTRFDSRQGGVVMSKPTRVVLPGAGKTRDGGADAMATASVGKAAATEVGKKAEATPPDTARQMITTTLSLPPRGAEK